ncbi:MAG: hypothetical protein ABWY06_16020 [Pseudomonas sp.]|uniref:hypothetical protein n=1 Tax=Pseudomonas sp. TaxID=306 RepID=UPI00339A7DD3
MKAWLAMALSAVLSLVAGAAWYGSPVPAPAPVVGPTAAASSRPPLPAQAPAPRVARPAAGTQAEAERPVAQQVVPEDGAPMTAEQAQGLMALMATEGDPRSPALQPSRPRVRASAAELADPALYAQFEDRQAREEILAYTAGVQQIPLIRERIEQAAQSGERSAQELDEARAALQQLEQLQTQLQREAPQLLPGVP